MSESGKGGQKNVTNLATAILVAFGIRDKAEENMLLAKRQMRQAQSDLRFANRVIKQAEKSLEDSRKQEE